MMQDIEVLKANMETCALQSDIDEFDKKLKKYAPLNFMKEIKADQLRYCKREEFAILQSDIN